MKQTDKNHQEDVCMYVFHKCLRWQILVITVDLGNCL